jgi:hypothetical protein
MIIEELTPESILDDSVFEEIMDEKDEIKRARMIQSLTDKATLLGVKTKFNKILVAYKKKEREYLKEINQKKKQNTYLNNYTEFDVEGTEYENLFCGPWTANEQGIHMTIYIGNLPVEKVACYHPILPVYRMENAETGREKVKLAFRSGLDWKEIIIDKGVIASANKIVGLSDYGISVTSESAKSLVTFLSDLENYNRFVIKRNISTSKLGWIRGEFMPYGKNIIFDNEVRFKNTFESISQTGDREIWYELTKVIRRSNRIEPKIYLAGALASVLVEPLNALPFIINLWGDTGKGKTVAIMFAASVWANPSGNEYVTDPKSTLTALELRMDFLNNLPMLIDDMAQLKERYGTDFSELIYMLCSGKGKDRANSTLGLNKQTTWKNVILTNAEHSLTNETSQGGAVNRVIDLEMEDGYIFNNGNYVVETIKKNYGWCGKEFVDVIEDIGFEEVKEMQKDFLSRINERAKSLGVEKEEKQALPMSLLLTADKIATDNLFHDGIYLDFDLCVNLLKNKGEVNENERAYEFVMSEIAVNSTKFNVPIDYKGEIWGETADDYIYIVSSVFSKICERGNFSSKSFLSWANKKNLISTSKDRLTKKKRICGSPCWCVCIKKMSDKEDTDGFHQVDDDELPFD